MMTKHAHTGGREAGIGMVCAAVPLYSIPLALARSPTEPAREVQQLSLLASLSGDAAQGVPSAHCVWPDTYGGLDVEPAGP